jgi:streptogramin lyase
MWFDEVVGQRIGRIAADGTITEFALPPGTFPIPIATGPGARDIWFGEPFNHKIDRMDVCAAPQFRLECGLAARVLRDPRHFPPL